MKHLIHLLIFAFIISCKTGTDREIIQKYDTKKLDSDSKVSERLDTVEQIDNSELDFITVNKKIEKPLIKENFSVDLKKQLTRWIDYYKQISPDFKISEFINYENKVLQPYQVTLGDNDFKKRFFNLYNPYLKWSPDSSKAIDLYSYTYVLDFDSEGNIVGFADIDCQLAIIDLEKQKRIVLQTFGSAGKFQDSFWMNNDSIIVAWIGSSNGETYEPFYSMIDLNTYLINNYKLNARLNLKESNYADLIFKDIKFE